MVVGRKTRKEASRQLAKRDRDVMPIQSEGWIAYNKEQEERKNIQKELAKQAVRSAREKAREEFLRIFKEEKEAELKNEKRSAKKAPKKEKNRSRDVIGGINKPVSEPQNGLKNREDLEKRNYTFTLDNMSDDEFVAYALKRASDNPAVASGLGEGLAITFGQVSTSSVDSTPTLALAAPSEAPRLWVDRAPGVTAVQFLRETYAPWIEAGVLTRTAIKDYDPQLYSAYAVRVHRHPEEAITFANSDRKPGRQPEADAEGLIERRRIADREAKALKRQHDKMSHGLM